MSATATASQEKTIGRNKFSSNHSFANKIGRVVAGDLYRLRYLRVSQWIDFRTLLERFSLTARMFYSGRLCGISGNQERTCRISSLAQERKTEDHSGRAARQITIDTPSIVFLPRPHRLASRPRKERGRARVRDVRVWRWNLNPLWHHFRAIGASPRHPSRTWTALQLLFSEGFSDSPGREASRQSIIRIRPCASHSIGDGRAPGQQRILMGLSDIVWPRRSMPCINILKRPGRWKSWLNRQACPVRASLLIFARLSA